MRIRQVRPEFWADEKVASWPLGRRFFYIGLWGICDDAGYFEFSISRIAAVLFPYEARRTRERNVAAWLEALEEAGKVRRLEGCSHAIVPTLTHYQRVGGVPTIAVKKDHEREQMDRSMNIWSTPSNSGSRVEVGRGEVSRGSSSPAAAPLGARVGLAEIIGPFEEIIASKNRERPA
jgi:hypothetical protein